MARWVARGADTVLVVNDRVVAIVFLFGAGYSACLGSVRAFSGASYSGGHRTLRKAQNAAERMAGVR